MSYPMAQVELPLLPAAPAESEPSRPQPGKRADQRADQRPGHGARRQARNRPEGSLWHPRG